MKDLVMLEIYTGNILVRDISLKISEWYDAEIIELDNDEYRAHHKISLIKGTQYNLNGEVEEVWINYYDNLGRLTKTESYDSKLTLIDVEEIGYDENGRIIF